MSEQTVKEQLIRRRRGQMLIHSYIYYWLGESIITDDTWQAWANELKELQTPPVKIGFYDKEFKDWDGSTGCHLPRDTWVITKARQLLRYAHEHNMPVNHVQTKPVKHPATPKPKVEPVKVKRVNTLF